MTTGRPAVLGEVLFDCFEDQTTLGGAPFNVAWHLQGFGLDPLFISRVGEDALGDQVLESMQRWGMDTAGLQRDPSHPTGRVQVTLEEGQPTYDILPKQAYDFVEWSVARPVADKADLALLYHGTLALRHDITAATRAGFVKTKRLPVFVDVNLRPPWWTVEGVTEFIEGAGWVKLNDDELNALGGDGGDLSELARDLKSRLKLAALIVTQGAEGAFALVDEQRYEARAPAVERIADTVGAGDAFTSVVLLGILRDWSWAQTLARAAEFAAVVCGYRGAIKEDAELYADMNARWQS